MEWRTQGTEEVTSRRVCPTCRKASDYVVPSRILPRSDGEKEDLLKSYRERLSKLPCKRWCGVLGSCPFGRDCFYAHLDDDGKDIKSQDRTMQQLYEERERHRENQREGMEMEMLSELIMMGMQRNLFGPARRRGRRNRQEDDDDEMNPFEMFGEMFGGGDHFMNSLLNHFMNEHRRHAGYDDDSEDDSGSDSSMPELENVPRHGGANNMPPLLPNNRRQHQPPQEESEDEESIYSESEFYDSTDESDDGSMPPLEDANRAPSESDDDSMPELEEMPPRQS